MNKFRRKAKKSLLGALSLLSAFSSVAPMSAMNRENGEVGVNVDYDDDDLSGYDADDEREDGVSPESKKSGLSTAAKIGIGVGAGGAAALGIGILASYLSKSNGEIGKKITIEDIDLQDKYNNGAIDGFAVGDEINSATMKQEFPNSQSKIKDGFLYEYLGGKEFKVVDVYLNNGESRVYLGADIKNSPTLKNMNETNGNPIDSKAHYKVTRTGDNYTIAKSDAPNLNPPVAPVVPVQNLPNQPVMPPVPPANNLPVLYTVGDALALANNALFNYDRAELDDGGEYFLYEIDGTTRKFKMATLNTDVFSAISLGRHQSYNFALPISGQILINTLDKFPNKCKLYGQCHKLDPNLRYNVGLKYDRDTKGIRICPLLPANQIISASQAYDLDLIHEEPQPNAFFIVGGNNVLQPLGNVAVSGNRLFEDNKDRLGLNPGLVYVLHDDQFIVQDINKEYLRSHKDNRFTIEELSSCSSLKETLMPGTSLKFRDLGGLNYVPGPQVSFADLDCEVTDLDNLSVRLVSSAPLNTFMNLFGDALDTFKIYENPGSLAPLTVQQLQTVQGNRRVRQDQRTGKLYLTQMPGDLSRAEDNILHPPVRPLPSAIHDGVPVPGVFDSGFNGAFNVLGNNIWNRYYIPNSQPWTINKYLNHLIDTPTAQPHPIAVVGANAYAPGQGFARAHSLSDQFFKDIFGDLLASSVDRGGRYVRKRFVKGSNGDNNIYYLYEIVGRSNDADHTPRYASFLIRIGNQVFGADNINPEPRFLKSDNAPDLQNIPFDTWCRVPY